MTLLAALLVAQTPASPASEFFPLVAGSRRTYEETGMGKATVIDEVGPKPVFFQDQPATEVVQKNAYNQPIGATYYRIDGATVFLVGYAEDRRAASANVGDAYDLKHRGEKKKVFLQLLPAMPVFKFDGKETSWSFAEIPILRGPASDAEPIKMDPTTIRGVARLGKERTVLGRKVGTLEVRSDVTLGVGEFAQKVVETSVYGRGIGLVESIRKTSGGGQKATETRLTLVAIEDKG